MVIILKGSDGTSGTFDKEVVSIGRAGSCDMSLPYDERLQPLHATIRKVAGKWMIESAGDWEVRVGSGTGGRKLWLKSGDVLHLAHTGPEIVFTLIDKQSDVCVDVPDHTPTKLPSSNQESPPVPHETGPSANVEPPPLPSRSSFVGECGAAASASRVKIN